MTVIIRCCDARFVWYGTDSLGIYLSIESSSLGGFFYSLLGRYDIFYYFLPYLNLIKPRFAYICLKYIIYEFLKKNNIAWKMTLFFSVAYKLIFNKVSQYSLWKLSCPLIFFKLQHICLWHKWLSFCRCQFIHVQF